MDDATKQILKDSITYFSRHGANFFGIPRVGDPKGKPYCAIGTTRFVGGETLDHMGNFFTPCTNPAVEQALKALDEAAVKISPDLAPHLGASYPGRCAEMLMYAKDDKEKAIHTCEVALQSA